MWQNSNASSCVLTLVFNKLPKNVTYFIISVLVSQTDFTHRVVGSGAFYPLQDFRDLQIQESKVSKIIKTETWLQWMIVCFLDKQEINAEETINKRCDSGPLMNVAWSQISAFPLVLISLTGILNTTFIRFRSVCRLTSEAQTSPVWAFGGCVYLWVQTVDVHLCDGTV